MRATTKGSIADKTWEESAFLSASITLSSRLAPKDKREKLPSRLCHPTFPINGDDVVEQAMADKEPNPRKPLFKNGRRRGLFVKAREKERELGFEVESLGRKRNDVGAFGWREVRVGARDIDGIITDISNWFTESNR